MKTDHKIPLETVVIMLGRQKGVAFTVHEIETLIFGWIRHPKYLSISRATLPMREDRDGFRWLKPDEIVSLFTYAGYPIRRK